MTTHWRPDSRRGSARTARPTAPQDAQHVLGGRLGVGDHREQVALAGAERRRPGPAELRLDRARRAPAAPAPPTPVPWPQPRASATNPVEVLSREAGSRARDTIVRTTPPAPTSAAEHPQPRRGGRRGPVMILAGPTARPPSRCHSGASPR